MKSFLLFTIITFGIISCGQGNGKNSEVLRSTTDSLKLEELKSDSLQKELFHSVEFFGDSLLHNKTPLLKAYLLKYQKRTCGIQSQKISKLISEFDGVQSLGALHNDGIIDTVFILPPFQFCDNGNSYVFFDTTLPRLLVESLCNHPSSLFSVGDIDEDGIDEICIYYSTCVSRFKSLRVYSLKNTEWKMFGECTFDTFFQKPTRENRFRKIRKSVFELLEITSNGFENSKVEKTWHQFTIR